MLLDGTLSSAVISDQEHSTAPHVTLKRCEAIASEITHLVTVSSQ